MTQSNVTAFTSTNEKQDVANSSNKNDNSLKSGTRWIEQITPEQKKIISPASTYTPPNILVQIITFPFLLLYLIFCVIPVGIGVLFFIICPGKSRTGKVQEQASKTALIVARMRHIGNMFGACDDNLARYFIPWNEVWSDRVFVGIMKWHGAITEGIACDITVRCCMADECVRRFVQRQSEAGKEKTSSIVLLGAGLDTKLYRLDIPDGFKLYEVDVKPSQNAKLSAIKKSKIENADRVKFVSCDFANETFIDALKNNDWDPESETLFLWEGVTYYLEQEAVDRTMELIGQCAKGSELYVDVFNKPKGIRSTAQYIATKKLVKDRGEPMLSRFEDVNPETMNSYLSQYNLELVELINTRDARKYFLTAANGKTKVGTGSGFFNFLLAQVK